MPPQTNRNVEIHFVDVGQGHATVMVDRLTNKAILVDCPAGGEPRVRHVLDSLNATLQTSFITHFDKDHSAGVSALLASRECSTVVLQPSRVPSTPTNSQEVRQILGVHKRYGNVVLNNGRGSVGRIQWRIIGPSRAVGLSAQSVNSRNRESLCLMFEVAPVAADGRIRRILVLGDADGFAISDLLDRQRTLPCDALLWPHHGALVKPDDVQVSLLSASSPSVVIVGVGSRNRFGHPAPQLVSALTTGRRRMICTEVTPKCHSAVAGATICGGTVVAKITPTGRWSVSPTAAAHEHTIMQWSSPMCR